MSRKKYLVDFGPDSKQHMTYRTKEAIAESDVVIGYTTYIKLVKDLLDGKKAIIKGMAKDFKRRTEWLNIENDTFHAFQLAQGDFSVFFKPYKYIIWAAFY